MHRHKHRHRHRHSHRHREYSGGGREEGEERFLPDVVTPCYTGTPLFSSFTRITKSRQKCGPKNGRTKYKVVCLSVTLLISSMLLAFPLVLLPLFFRELDRVVGTGAGR